MVIEYTSIVPFNSLSTKLRAKVNSGESLSNDVKSVPTSTHHCCPSSITRTLNPQYHLWTCQALRKTSLKCGSKGISFAFGERDFLRAKPTHVKTGDHYALAFLFCL
jgi:hypothetical protein